MFSEIVHFLLDARSLRAQVITWIAGICLGLSVCGIVGFQTLVWQDLFHPTWAWAGFAAGGVCALYLIWIAYSAILAQWSGRPVCAILQDDAYAYMGLVLLLFVWLKHVDYPTSFAVVFASSVVVTWKVWNLPVTWPTEELRSVQKYGFLLAMTLMAVYVVGFSTLSGLRVMGFQTYGDFAGMIQPIWGFGHGRVLFMTQLGNSFWGAHFWPTLLLLGPLYRVYEHPVTLVVIQSIALGLGALPVYWLARIKLNSDLLSIVFAVAYLLYPAIQLSNLGDFHETLLVPPLLLFMLYCLETKRYKALAVFTLLTLGCKEDMGIPVLAIGLYAIGIKRAYKVGTALSLGGLLWFYIVVFQVIPYFAQGDPYLYVQASPLTGGVSGGAGARVTELVHQIFTTTKIISVTQLLLPLGFLAGLAPFSALMIAAPLGELFVYTGPPFGLVGTIYTWHIVTVVPFVFFAAMEGVATLRRWLCRIAPGTSVLRATTAITAGLVLCMVGTNMSFGAIPFRPNFNWKPYQITEHARVGHTLLRLIPPGTPVTATAELAAHLSHREEIYSFPNPFIRVNWFSEVRKPVAPEYVIVDTSAVALARMTTSQGFMEAVKMIGVNPDYETLAAQDGYVIFKHKAPYTSPDQEKTVQ